MFDPTFMMFAQACGGDFTYGQEVLNNVARLAADRDYSLDDACHYYGVVYSNLLEEEKNYLKQKVRECENGNY